MSGREAAAFYTRYADWYDRIASDTPLVGRLRERVVDALDPRRGDVVVEMGCGTGANLPLLRERVGPGGTVIGLDVSTGVLARARERIDRAGWGNVHVARADATRPPLRSGASSRATAGATGDEARDIDAVLATFLTGMLVDPAGAVDDWCRLVTADGSSDHPPAGRVCVAGLARSTHPIGRFLNPLFAAGVRTAAPPSGGTRTRRPTDEPAVERLDRRALAAHRRVHERCPDAHTTRLFAGFARITTGSVIVTDTTDSEADTDVDRNADADTDATDGGR